MKPKITKDLQNNDQEIAQRVYSMYYNNYKRGLQEQAQEVNGTDATNNVADIVVDPTANDKTRNTSSKSFPFSKPALVGATSSNNLSSAVSTFIKESQILDNELNQLMAELKVNQTDDFYESYNSVQPPTKNHLNRATWIPQVMLKLKMIQLVILKLKMTKQTLQVVQ